LKRAKDLVDGAPKPVKENIGKDEANAVKKKARRRGGTVELKSRRVAQTFRYRYR